MTVVLELDGFPPPVHVPHLQWIGMDYTTVLVNDLIAGLRRQDPGTLVMGVRCEGLPEMTTSVDPGGFVHVHDVRFALRVFVSDSEGRPWRLRGRFTYTGRNLGTHGASVTHYWELREADGV